MSFSDQEISVIAAGGYRQIAQWVLATAQANKLSIRQASNTFAQSVSRLSDAETDLDKIEQLLIVLSRAQVITPHQRGLLQVQYLRSKLHA